MASADESKPAERPFYEDVARTLTRLRSELSEVIAAVPEEVRRGADLHRALQIDRKLSWRIFKIASATDPVAAGPHVPSRANLRSFLRAATKQGVPAGLIEAASSAADEFEEMVAKHAGDRATFDSMVSALGSGETAQQLNLVHRRQAFRGQRHILGVSAKTQLKLVALRASKNPRLLDGVRVEGLIDLRQLRGNAPLILSYSGARDDDGCPMAVRREPLEPITGSHGMSLLRDFCSQPLPELRSVEVSQGFVMGELVAQDVGNRGTITCIEGHATPAALPRYSEKGNRVSGTLVAVRVPCEVLVLDLLLHKDAYGLVKPRSFVYAEHLRATTWIDGLQEQHRLPFNPTVDYLGRGASVLHTVNVPRYAELGKYVFERMDWDGEQFDVYRCRIQYPVMPSSLEVRFDLPEVPSEL